MEVTINVSKITRYIWLVVPFAALIAATITLCKAAGVAMPVFVKGSLQDWTYVAVACAAARMAR